MPYLDETLIPIIREKNPDFFESLKIQDEENVTDDNEDEIIFIIPLAMIALTIVTCTIAAITALKARANRRKRQLPQEAQDVEKIGHLQLEINSASNPESPDVLNPEDDKVVDDETVNSSDINLIDP